MAQNLYAMSLLEWKKSGEYLDLIVGLLEWKKSVKYLDLKMGLMLMMMMMSCNLVTIEVRFLMPFLNLYKDNGRT